MRSRPVPAAPILLGLLLAGSACGADLQGSEWRPLTAGGTGLADQRDIFLQFRSKGRLAGFGGCNHLFAEYQAADGYLFIGPLASTRMRCEPAVAQLESALTAALGQVRTYRRDRTRLTLFDSDGSPILELRQTDWD